MTLEDQIRLSLMAVGLIGVVAFFAWVVWQHFCVVPKHKKDDWSIAREQ